MVDLTEGARYRYVTHPHQPTGTIKSLDFQFNRAQIAWDDTKLIPSVQEFNLDHFFDGTFESVIPNLVSGHGWDSVRCECGVDKTMGADADPQFHSDWCPKYRRPN
jgi:hypothetical protein